MEKRTIKVHREGIEKEYLVDIPENSLYSDLTRICEDDFSSKITLAKVDNVLFELAETIADDVEEITFLDTVNTDGYRVYMRTLSFVFIAAVEELFPEYKIVFEHSISGGAYCTIRKGNKPIVIDSQIRDKIKKRMEQIIDDDLPIERMEYSLEQAGEIYKEAEKTDKIDLLFQREKNNVNVYKMGGCVDSFYGYLLPSSGYVKTFGLELFNKGIVLIGLDREDKNKLRNFSPQHKLSQAYNELENWSELQGISRVADLNEIINNGEIGEVCRMIETLQSHKLVQIAKEIYQNNKRIILIAAPSSSGKTSFAYKLTTDLKVLGMRPIAISIDDYYMNRKDTPLDENGNYDFESPSAIDLKLFNEDINKLLKGEEIERIKFDFKEGVRIYTGEKIKINGRDPIIIEGIHALNPLLTRNIVDDFKYRIYLSVITQINLDDHNRIPTTDLRLMRRMSRDKQFRGKSIEKTILEWESVRDGEKKYIFPYQEQADVIFNSSFIYEIAALKPILMDELTKIPQESDAYIEAQRIKSLLQYFVPLEDTSDIINTSILREFIGGSKIV